MKTYSFDKSESDSKSHVCEICGQEAVNGQPDKDGKIRYSCLATDHIKRLYSKIEKEKRET